MLYIKSVDVCMHKLYIVFCASGLGRDVRLWPCIQTSPQTICRVISELQQSTLVYKGCGSGTLLGLERLLSGGRAVEFLILKRFQDHLVALLT